MHENFLYEQSTGRVGYVLRPRQCHSRRRKITTWGGDPAEENLPGYDIKTVFQTCEVQKQHVGTSSP